MDAADAYVGDDGRVYRNPCTSQRGQRKERWPNETAACYVVELAALGMHRVRGQKIKLYPYECPRCGGWHLARVRTEEHYDRHRRALEAARKTKPVKPQNNLA